MAVKGVFASDAGIVGDRVGDFASALLQIMPTGSAPMLALSSGMPTKDAMDTIVNWFEENHLSGRINVVNNAGTAGAWTADDGSDVIPGAIFLIEASGEYAFVTAVSGNALTVERGFAGTTAGAIDGSVTPVPIQRIGTAQEEGSDRPTAVANLGYPRFNYTQIFRNAWDVTGTAQVVEFHTGDVVAKNKRDAAMIHAEDIEKALLHGRRSIGVKNSRPFRTMDGIITQVTTNIETIADPTYGEVNSFIQSIFERNVKGKPNERIAFCGNQPLRTIDLLANNQGTINIAPGQTDFGLEIFTWRTVYGTIKLMSHPLMVESPLWTNELYVLHPGAIRTRWLRRTFEKTYDDDSGADGDFGTFTSELCVEYRAEITAGVWTGMGDPDLTTLV